jgi:WD40 repeat protein
VKATFTGHADFVKSLLYIPRGNKTGLLLSGSSDANIIIWDAVTGERLATLRGHTRAVGTMAVDPVLSSEGEAVVLAGGSEREIRCWKIPLDRPGVAVESGERIVEFETSVHRLRFIGEDADCWGASADGTARRLEVRADGEKKVGERSEMVLRHGDYVNDVVLAGAGGRWVVTACRDEEVRIWDAAVSSS